MKLKQQLARFQFEILKDMSSKGQDAARSQIALVLFLSVFFFRSFATNTIIISTFIAIFVVNVIRVFFLKKLGAKSPQQGQGIILVFALVTGTLWGVFLSRLVLDYPYGSSYMIVAFFVMAGFSAAALQSLGILVTSYYSFIIPLVSLPLASMWFLPEFSKESVLIIYLFGFVYVLYLSKIQKSYRTNFLELLESKDLLQEIIDSMPAAISVIEDKKYVFANRKLTEINDLDAKALIGKPLGFFKGNDQVSQIISSFAAKESKFQSLEIEIPVVEGNQLKSKRHLLLLQKIESRKDMTLAISIDVHHLREVEKLLDSHQKLMETSNKLITLGEMTAGIAHEIKTPLAIIQGQVDGLSREISGESINRESLKKRFEKINATVFKINDIVNNMRKLSRTADPEERRPFNVNSAIQEVLVLVQDGLKKHQITLEFEAKNLNLEVLGNSIHFQQVIMNLISNAMDAVKSGTDGRWIRIQLSVDEEKAELYIDITDSGRGVPEELRDKIFEPFYTTKPVGEGTGLGLSISRKLMQEMNGNLILDGKQAHTNFKICLPLYAKAMQS